MRLLANENVPQASVRRLREAGHDVASVASETPGVSDLVVLQRASEERRIVLTFDRDYGELIYRLGAPSPAGIVYLRFTPANPEEPADILQLALLVQGLSLEGRFTVLDRDKARQRPLPTA